MQKRDENQKSELIRELIKKIEIRKNFSISMEAFK